MDPTPQLITVCIDLKGVGLSVFAKQQSTQAVLHPRNGDDFVARVHAEVGLWLHRLSGDLIPDQVDPVVSQGFQRGSGPS